MGRHSALHRFTAMGRLRGFTNAQALFAVVLPTVLMTVVITNNALAVFMLLDCVLCRRGHRRLAQRRRDGSGYRDLGFVPDRHQCTRPMPWPMARGLPGRGLWMARSGALEGSIAANAAARMRHFAFVSRARVPTIVANRRAWWLSWLISVDGCESCVSRPNEVAMYSACII